MIPDVVVVGAGPGGSALTARLARCGHGVRVLDRFGFPRTKLCGEFMSPEVMGELRALGVADVPVLRVAPVITSVRLEAPGTGAVEHTLGGHARGLSRRALDAALLDRAHAEGVEVLTGRRVVAVERGARTTRLRIVRGGAHEEQHAPIVVLATGNSPAPVAGRRSPARSRWVGFGRHHRGRVVPDDVRGRIGLFCFPGGYLGISEIENGGVNVCGLVRTSVLRECGGRIDAVMARVRRLYPNVGDWLAGPEPLAADWRTMSLDRFGQRRDVFAVGDARGAVSPVVGDGVAMALRSAELMADALHRHLAGHWTLHRAQATYERWWRREFAFRLRMGALAHEAAVRAPVARLVLGAARRVPPLMTWLIRSTRGDARKPCSDASVWHRAPAGAPRRS